MVGKKTYLDKEESVLKISILILLVLIGQSLLANKCSEIYEGDISPKFVKKLKKKSANKSPLKQRMNDAVKSFGLHSVNQSQSIVANHNPYYTNMVESGTINNQQQSGRCWIFAGTNMLRTKLIRRKSVPKDFDFSQSYLHFFSQLERTNSSLEGIIKAAGQKVSDRRLQNILQFSLGDGGFFQDFSFLVEKYGLVPMSAMPDHFSVTRTAAMREEIKTYVQKGIDQLWRRADEFKGNSDHVERYMQGREANKFADKNYRKLTASEVAELREMKEDILAGVWEILETHLGTPPTKFNTKVLKVKANKKAKSDAKKKEVVQVSKTYTPREFARNFVNYNADDFAVITHLKSRQIGQTYQSYSATTIAPQHPFSHRFLNLEQERMLELLEQTIDAGYSSWIAAQFGPNMNNSTGIMHPELQNTEGIYEFPKGSEPIEFNKVQSHYYWKAYANHAVLVDAYDKPKNAAQTVKYRIQNSWSNTAGDKGYYHMYREWAKEHLYEIIIPKSLLTPEELKLWNSRAKTVSRDYYF